MIFIGGDFNAKVGKKIYHDEKCCRQYSRGIRNENGSRLINFCQFHDLIITNTLFQHPARHITTWTGYRKNNNNDIAKIYNQIDYVICKYNQSAIINNSRACGGTELNSDPKIVICKINFKKMYPNWKEMTKRNNSKKEINYEMLKEKETEFKIQIESKINNTENITWDSLKNIMKQSAIETVGMRKKIKKRYEFNNEIHLSTMQKEIIIKINTPNNTINKAKWKIERNKILLEIGKICKKVYKKCLEKQLQLMEKSRNDKQTFQAMKFIYRKFPDKLFLNDQENKQILNETEVEMKVKQF